MRNAFANELTSLAKSNNSIVLLTGDIGNKLFDNLKSLNAEKVLNCGIAEQSMIGVAAGMAHMGYKPFIYTITPFTTYRNFEQIRVDLCYNNLPAVIVGTGSGLSYASLGPTHQSLEDVAILRTLPNMTIFCPCDPEEVRLGLKESISHKSPLYIRLGKKGETNLSDIVDRSFKLGKAVNLRKGRDICIIGYGPILSEVLEAAKHLLEMGIDCQVENFHTIKPLDEERLKDLDNKFENIIVVEEHTLFGGLYGAVAEFWIKERLTANITSVATYDEFLHEIGDQNFARKHFGIGFEGIERKVLDVCRK